MRKLRVRSTDERSGRHGQILPSELLLLSESWPGDDAGPSALGGICQRRKFAHRMVRNRTDLSQQRDDFGPSAKSGQKREDSGRRMRFGEVAARHLLSWLFEHEWS